MPFDPTKPATKSKLSSAEMRAQLNGLADLTHQSASGIAPVIFADGDSESVKSQKLADKLNELIAAQGGQVILPAASVSIHDNPPRLDLSAPGDNPVSWVVESSTDESNWTDLATIDGSADTWAISDTNLYYRVRGVDANGVTVIADSNSVLLSRDS